MESSACQRPGTPNRADVRIVLVAVPPYAETLCIVSDFDAEVRDAAAFPTQCGALVSDGPNVAARLLKRGADARCSAADLGELYPQRGTDDPPSW